MSEQLRLHLPDTETTLALGAELARLLSQPGSPRVVLLFGDMGSGKTTLVRGLVSALEGGADAEISSPSFTLVNSYPTRPPVLHADLFRCEPADSDNFENSGHVAGAWAAPGDIPDELAEALELGALPQSLDAPHRWPLLPPRYGHGEPALVLLEWAERLPPALRPAQRLDILMQACHSARLFLATAHGDAACCICDSLKKTWGLRT